MNKDAILKEFEELNQCDGVIIHGYKDCSVCADDGNCGFQKQSRFVLRLIIKAEAEKKNILRELRDITNQTTTKAMHESILYDKHHMYREGWHNLRNLIIMHINKELLK